MSVSQPYQWDKRRIISVDGEGQTVAGRHAYTLLAAADDRGFRAHIEHDGFLRPGTGSQPYRLTDTAPNHGLSTKRCFDFLLSLPRHKSDLIVSFAFTYDVTKIIQDFPLLNLIELAEFGVTRWLGYEIRCMPRKYLMISRMGRSVTVNDVFSFWQSSFVKALADSKVLFTPGQIETIDFIAYMKEHRAEFDSMPDDEIREYCFTECEFLSIMMRDFLYQMDVIGLRVTNHSISGPGGIAQEYFAQRHLKEFMPVSDDLFAAPGLPLSIPLMSYYGGRFEISVIGSIGYVISHDLHSAYPAQAVNLPCLRCGFFKPVPDYVPGKLGFYLAGSRTSGKWAPFPFRSDSENRWIKGLTPGSIAFAHGGKRWVTSQEVAVARKHFGADAIPVYAGYVYHTPCKHRPFRDLKRLYLRRKEGNPSPGLSMIIKLIINSVYGKLAQTVGKGTYRCHIWAAWITGGTRAAIFDAIMQAPDSVVSAATDGILTRTEIPESEDFRVTDHDLGTWDREEKADCWLGMPGIYGFGSDDDNAKAFKRRGLDRRYFPLSHLRRNWEAGEWVVFPTEPVRGFMPFRLAVQRKNSLDVLGEWPELPKTVKFTSNLHKRHFATDADYQALAMGRHDGTAIELDPITVPDDSMSAPYKIAPRVAGMPELDEPVFEQEDIDPDFIMPRIYAMEE